MTGDIGISLFHYLRGVGAYVLPSRSSGVTTFGCHFESETDSGKEYFVIRPWDGVGRRVVVRQFAVEVIAEVGQIVEVKIDSRKRHATVTMKNNSDSDLISQFRVKGMWGNHFEVAGKEMQGENGELKVTVLLPPGATIRTEILVKK